MGSCCEKSSQESRNDLAPMTIYGDYYDRDTRALLAICDMCKVQVSFKYVCTFNGTNLEDSYTNMNVTGKIPTLSRGLNVVTTNVSIRAPYAFLLENFSAASQALYNPFQAARISELFAHLTSQLRPDSD